MWRSLREEIMKGVDTLYKRPRDLPNIHVLSSGTSICAGCGGLQAVHEILDILGPKTVTVNAAGCMSLLSVYPFTPFSGSWLYTAMASAPAGAQGVRDALDRLLAKKRISADEDMQVVVLSGDGSATGIGLSATSGAIDRKLDFIYICYDNEGYGNTGQQFSAGTPHGASTTTSRGEHGYCGYKKDLFSIWKANHPAYLATVSGAEPLDLARKIEKAKSIKGPSLIIAFSPCPTGWHFPPQESIEIGKLAIKTGVWPLKEYEEGKIVHTHIPARRLPVTEYLKKQGRFAHLFHPGNDYLIKEMQTELDAYWSCVEKNVRSDKSRE
jgi:pyruvate ferredoxin oxidoreductase beta subunit